MHTSYSLYRRSDSSRVAHVLNSASHVSTRLFAFWGLRSWETSGSPRFFDNVFTWEARGAGDGGSDAAKIARHKILVWVCLFSGWTRPKQHRCCFFGLPFEPPNKTGTSKNRQTISFTSGSPPTPFGTSNAITNTVN